MIGMNRRRRAAGQRNVAIAYVRVANRSFDPKVVRAADSIREQKRSTP